jgi:hypothetical protein
MKICEVTAGTGGHLGAPQYENKRSSSVWR